MAWTPESPFRSAGGGMGRAPGGKVLDIGGATPAALGHGRGLVAHAEVVLSQGQTRPTAMA